MSPAGMYLLIESCLEYLPGAMKEHENPDGRATSSCSYTPHFLRGTTATPLPSGIVFLTSLL